MERSVFTMMSSLISDPEIRADMDQHKTGCVNIHIGTLYLSMTLTQFDQLILAVSDARVKKAREHV
jgi:hypothetical protein